METILIFPLLIAATVAVYTLAAKIINSGMYGVLSFYFSRKHHIQRQPRRI